MDQIIQFIKQAKVAMNKPLQLVNANHTAH